MVSKLITITTTSIMILIGSSCSSPSHAATTATFASEILLPSPQTACSSSTLSSTTMMLTSVEEMISNGGGGGIDLELLKQSLVKPSDDKPQIKINEQQQLSPQLQKQQLIPQTQTQTILSKTTTSSSLKSKTKTPIMEGMIYLLDDKNTRPNLNDYIVITISSTKDPNQRILAGAKYNVYKAKFPFNFRLYRENIIQGGSTSASTSNDSSNAMEQIFNQDDLVVTARICPEESTKLPCTQDQSTYFAKSISKLLQIENLPGANQGDVIRTAVSLPLKEL